MKISELEKTRLRNLWKRGVCAAVLGVQLTAASLPIVFPKVALAGTELIGDSTAAIPTNVGTGNTAVGDAGTGQNVTGANNTGIGNSSSNNVTGASNTGSGVQSSNNVTGRAGDAAEYCREVLLLDCRQPIALSVLAAAEQKNGRTALAAALLNAAR